jgi:hypothetical protein
MPHRERCYANLAALRSILRSSPVRCARKLGSSLIGRTSAFASPGAGDRELRSHIYRPPRGSRGMLCFAARPNVLALKSNNYQLLFQSQSTTLYFAGVNPTVRCPSPF